MAGEQIAAGQQPTQPEEKYPPSMEGVLRKRADDLEAALHEIDRVENERTIPDRHGNMIESCNTTCLQECGALARKALRK